MCLQRRELSGIEGDRALQLLRVLLGYEVDDEEPTSPLLSSSEKVGTESNTWPCEEALHQLLTTVVFDHLALGKPEAIASWITVIQGMKKISQLSQNCGLLVWQVKLIQNAASFLVLLNHRDQRRYAGRTGGMTTVSVMQPSSSSSSCTHRVLCLPSLAITVAGAEADTSLNFSHHAFMGAAPTATDVSISGVTLSAAFEALPASPVSSTDTSFGGACGAPMDVTTDEFLPPQPVDHRLTRSRDTVKPSYSPRQLVTPDQAISLRCRLEELFDTWACDVAPQMLQYLQQRQEQHQSGYSAKTALTFLLYDVPPPAALISVMDKPASKLSLARSLHCLGVSPAIIQSVLASTSCSF
ncbi:hypothetical protein FHG87_015553 [Trinorchestia longiramus]|nr:hypothetical protein FHG87_015553 [Trinorchestia longiramus]